ncbi:MAG: flavin reductase family protein [Bacteroidetes bacterium]|nr:MAG: flavin reductase family protein [Bacteroidota bacterium]
MKSIYPKEIPTALLQNYIQNAVVPRPIALASTIDKEGNINLSPFSFFNIFSANPPILIFSPARRIRDNTEKHSLQNALEVGEVSINIVNFDMVEQISLASSEYEKGINEFTKAGLTEVKSTLISPPRVAESPASFECKVKQILPLGNEGGAGNLIICEIVLMHFQDDILDSKGLIDPTKIDAVARMGGNWYCRTIKESMFEIEKPIFSKGMGFENLPIWIRKSKVLTSNELAKLAGVEKIPSQEQFAEMLIEKTDQADKEILASKLLQENKVLEAWKVLLQ